MTFPTKRGMDAIRELMKHNTVKSGYKQLAERDVVAEKIGIAVMVQDISGKRHQQLPLWHGSHDDL